MSQPPIQVEKNVFINCPFDNDYRALLRTLVFTIRVSGFIPRCALEADNAVEIRVLKILRIINECAFGIHDLSRTELSAQTQLPRFNMPFELGLDFALCHANPDPPQTKSLLVLDSEPFRYQRFISDLAGVDIKAHRNDSQRMIQLVNDWLRTQSGLPDILGVAAIIKLFAKFELQFPRFVAKLGHVPTNLSFTLLDLCTSDWLQQATGKNR